MTKAKKTAEPKSPAAPSESAPPPKRKRKPREATTEAAAPPPAIGRLGAIRDRVLKVRCTSEEHEQVLAEARAQKLDASTIVRQALAHFRRRHAVDEARTLALTLIPSTEDKKVIDGLVRVCKLLNGGAS